MTTQRERLAAAIHEAICDRGAPGSLDEHLPDADALLDCGVRVVDVRLLTEAIRLNLKVVKLDHMILEEPVTIDGIEYWRRHPIEGKLAEAVLGTLDSEQ